MSSVKKVCYLDHPADAKYLGADYVVEFILQEYEYGGYTKLGETMRCLGQYDFDEYVNSKFSYRRMTYNIFVEAKNFRNLRDGVITLEKFNLRDEHLTQSNTPTHSDKKGELYPVQFRAAYSHGNTYISNEVSFLYNSTMRHRANGSVACNFDNQEIKPQMYDYSISQPGKDYTVSWNGYASFVFGKGWSLGIGSSVRFTHYLKTYEYSTTQSFSIIRNTRENSLESGLNAMLIKNLGSVGNLSFNLNGNLLSSHIDYRGDSESNNSYSFPFLAGNVSYSYNLNDWSIWSRVGVASEWNKMDEFKSNTVYPSVALNVGYSPNRKISGSVWLQWSTFSPTGVAKNPKLVRMSEYLYRQGNPEAGSYNNYEVSPSITWSPSNSFSLGVNVMYTHRHKRTILKSK